MRNPAFAAWLPIALLLACSVGDAARAPRSEKSASAVEVAFPPRGPIALRYTPPAPEGTLYALQLRYEGRSETQSDASSSGEPVSLHESLQLELYYREVPIATPTAGDFASSLLLDALRRRIRVAPPGTERSLEIADDRIRTRAGEKVEVELRGVQSKGDLSPRAVLGRPFALLVNDAQGNPKDVTLRGIPAAKHLFATLPIREAIAWTRLAFPDQPVSAGATWTATRYSANPVGRLGEGISVEYRLVGFEEIDGVPCAHVSVRGKRDTATATSAPGITIEQIRFELEGDAWVGLVTGEVQKLQLEDVAEVSYRRASAAASESVRAHYSGRTSLERLDASTTSKQPWADGTERFSGAEAKTGK